MIAKLFWEKRRRKIHTQQKSVKAASFLYSQLFAGDIIIRGPGLTTANIMVDSNCDMRSPEGQGDGINQRDKIRCGETTMLERSHVKIDTCFYLI